MDSTVQAICDILQNWLNTLLDSMQETVKNVIANISQTMIGDPEFEFLVGFWHFPGQVVINTDINNDKLLYGLFR